MNKLYLCDANYPYEDVPAIEINCPKDINEIFNYWMEGKSKLKVFVCFDIWKTKKSEECFSFLVTQKRYEIDRYVAECIFNMLAFPTQEICFSIFEFELWDEAFHFCVDFQEEM